MIKRSLILAAALLTCTPLAVSAKPISEKDVLSGKVKPDLAQGYILVSGTDRQSGLFLRVPDADTWAKWNAERDKAWAKAQRRYASDLAAWKDQVENAKRLGTVVPVRPEAPIIANLGIQPAELRDMESFGPMFAYGKDAAGVTYLAAVKPGTYVYYGPVVMGNHGAAFGSCMCMGTVRFEVKAGTVTDLGNALASLPQWNEHRDVTRLQLVEANAKRVAAGKPALAALAPVPPKAGVPGSLAKWPSMPAVLQANPKLNNYFGLTVSRLPAIPGVLAYHRDTVVDARTGQEIASPTLVSLAKAKK